MEFLAGIMTGIVIGLVAGMLAADAIQRNNRRERDDTPTRRELLAALDATRKPTPWVPQPAVPYQPPVIVLAAPMAQEPQTVNNYHAPSVTIHAPAGGMPLLADREREIQTQRGGRVFRVVGEREDWNE